MRFKGLKCRLRTSNESIKTKNCQSRRGRFGATKQNIQFLEEGKIGCRFFYPRWFKFAVIFLIKYHHSFIPDFHSTSLMHFVYNYAQIPCIAKYKIHTLDCWIQSSSANPFLVTMVL